MESDRTIFLSIAELKRRYQQGAMLSSGSPLTGSELRCFSQHGEDGVIGEILVRLGISDGFFVEFGIETGREGNCVFLADVLGWKGLFIEPDERSYSELAAKYSGAGSVRTMHAAVTPDNIESLFAAEHVPTELDVLSIDVDGQDYWIWEALEAYRPRVLVIEYNAILPAGRRLVQPRGEDHRWDGTDYFGSSLDAFCGLAEAKGYRLVHTDLAAINAFFVRGDLCDDAMPSPDRVPRRHFPNYFVQGYRHPVDPERREWLDLDTGLPSRRPGVPDDPEPEETEAQPQPAPQPEPAPLTRHWPARARAARRRLGAAARAARRGALRRPRPPG